MFDCYYNDCGGDIMGNVTSKDTPRIDADNTLRQAFNVEDKSITVNGFLVGKVGHKVVRTVVSATVDDYSFYDGTTLLYTFRITYNNAAHDEVDQAERTA